jgi:hypothetical protein
MIQISKIEKKSHNEGSERSGLKEVIYSLPSYLVSLQFPSQSQQIDNLTRSQTLFFSPSILGGLREAIKEQPHLVSLAIIIKGARTSREIHLSFRMNVCCDLVMAKKEREVELKGRNLFFDVDYVK